MEIGREHTNQEAQSMRGGDRDEEHSSTVLAVETEWQMTQKHIDRAQGRLRGEDNRCDGRGPIPWRGLWIYVYIYNTYNIYLEYWNGTLHVHTLSTSLENKKLACHDFLFRYLAIHDRRSILINWPFSPSNCQIRWYRFVRRDIVKPRHATPLIHTRWETGLKSISKSLVKLTF